MDELSKRRKWRRWLEMVEAEIGRLRKDMRIYAEIHQHLADNPDWSAWLENAYLVGVSLTIRRLVDANPRHRTVSLVKLLRDMEAHAECLSRRTALRSAGASRREEVNRLFDHLAGEGAPHIPQRVIRQWREEFEAHAVPFRAWVDHHIAHRDLAVQYPPPDRAQAERILQWLQDTVATLKTLLGA